MTDSRCPAEPRWNPAGSAAHSNPAAPLTPYIYNGVAGVVGSEPNQHQKQNPAEQRTSSKGPDPMSEPDDATYALLFPFVNVKSIGGKFDDDAFTAGYEVGGIGQRIAVQQAIGCLPYTATIRRDNLTQIDLIAMHFELTLTEVEWADDIEGGVKTEWAQISIDYPQPAPESAQ